VTGVREADNSRLHNDGLSPPATRVL